MADLAMPHASSTGQAQTEATWLDARFALARAAYEAQLEAVGIQSGWRVLDAGCGSGQFLPGLAALVGPTGQLVALDLAAENIIALAAKLQQHPLTTPVTACVASVVTLPFADGSFDAVWCANTSQYLRDAELAQALAALRRVTRPGGLVAVKESDATLFRLLPAPVGILRRGYEAAARDGEQEYGTLRAAELPAWLRRTGLNDVQRTTTLLETRAPLSAPARGLWDSYLAYCAERFHTLPLPHGDQSFWRRLRNPAQRAFLLDDPDFYGCEGNTLAVGRVGEIG